MKDKIQALAASFANEVIDYRHFLHANPELSFQEFNTAKFVAATLRSFAIEPQ